MTEFEFVYDPKETDVPKLHEQIVWLINKMRFPWRDFKEDPPEKGQSCIVLSKYGMHFYANWGDPSDPINVMNGLFYIPRNGTCAGLRYEVTDITHWVPLPEAYDS